MAQPVIGIVMAGGSGERFWPVSTATRPKQLLDLSGLGKSMLQQAIERLEPLATGGIYISTNPTLAGPIAESGLVPAERILAEPLRRNTLGALIWSTGVLAHRHQSLDFTMAVVTSDHVMRPTSGFQSTVAKALVVAEESDGLVTIGIPITRPEPGYGYIEKGDGTQVQRFAEKPDLATASTYMNAGNYLWNSGMFFWKASSFARHLRNADPGAAEILDVLARDLDAGERAFEKLENISVDKGLMEKASNVHVVPAEFEWDDVGSWDSLLRTVERDPQGNAAMGPVSAVETHGSVLYNASSRHRIVTLGVEGMAVIITDREVVVFPLERSQDVRQLAHLND